MTLSLPQRVFKKEDIRRHPSTTHPSAAAHQERAPPDRVRASKKGAIMAGGTDDLKGRIKKAVGELKDDDKLKQEGTVDKVAGKAKDAIDKAADKAKGALKKD